MFELKNSKIALAIASLLVVSTSSFAAYRVPASAMPEPESTNWYLQGFGGVTLMSRNHIADGRSITYKPGWDAGVAVGYRVGPFRFDLQYTFMRNRWDKLNNNSITSDENSRFTSFHMAMVNGFYDFTQFSDDYTPYVGGGIGMTLVRTSKGSIVAGKLLENGRFTWSGIVGVSYRWDNEWHLDARYRYISVAQPERQFTDRLPAHALELGVTYFM